jgi:hypothetical protein
MTYKCIAVECPRCKSRIEIVSGSITAEIFTCPVCQEGEIYYQAQQPALQPVSVIPQKKPQLERYKATLSNIWTN